MTTNLAAISAFLYREARHLDDREFEEWLQLYAPDCEYWMPAWDDDDQLTEDPHSQISLIYYPNRNGLEDRALRIRQYEDFFNVSGMGTADDLEEFRSCQIGYGAKAAPWNDLSRGAPLWIEGPDENAKKMGMKPLISGERSEDEGLFVCQHDYWAQAMRKGVQQERAGEQA